ncbi:Gldg family protein [Verrucomicrobiaceae bacterium R5-34]|nr:Gldg family protein [Verrucomicrobiaceae bacterium R5-34]
MAKSNKESTVSHRSPKAKVTHPFVRTVLGIVAIVCILVFSNWLVRATSLGNKTIDLTENQRHTLTPGTKAILSELETPVIIRYYATRKSEAMPRRVKNYMRKVDNLLARYKQLADGKIRIENLDPEPDTDAEDSANLDGISGQRVEDENVYFGLSISCLDQQTSIPFLDPANDTMLEYMLSSAIANVTTFKKPTIGLMTTLPLAGTPAVQPGAQPGQPWIIYQLLQQRYEIQNLGMSPEQLDPEQTPVLLLVHPAGLSSHTEYLIDQYLLKGGVLVACLDSFALTAPAQDPRMRGMGGMGGGVNKSSTLPKLLERWGLGMDAYSVLADGKYATDFGNNQRMHAHLSLSTEAIVSDDEIITKGFENLYFPLAGGFTVKGDSDVSIETLISSSDQVVLIAGQEATQADSGIFARQQPTGESYGLVMRLNGKFKTAFSKGDPDAETEDGEEAPVSGLQEATEPSSVYLISDADFLFDRACFQQSQQGYVAVNNNAALLQNILDQCTGSKHLIGSRSRASTTRPFTIIKEMETDFEKDLHEDVDRARTRMNEIVQELQNLQMQKTQGTALVLTDEQEAKIRELQAQQMKLRRDLREKEKSLRDRKDKLYAKITWMTVASTPLFVAISGLAVWFFRRRATRAA